MLLDFEFQRSTRRCAATDRRLEPGETFYSSLHTEGAEIVRCDYAADAWQGPPEAAIGWWKSRVPTSDSQQPKLAPNEVLLGLFDELADRSDSHDMRYVLTLLLVRRRVLRIEEHLPKGGAGDGATLVVLCPSRDETYEVSETMPNEERIEQIQEQLTELLYSDAA